MTETKTTTSTATRPELPQSKAGRRALVVYGLLTLVKAAGWILIAQAIATAIAPFAIDFSKADVPSLKALLTPTVILWDELPPGANLGLALALGLVGAALRSLAAWGIEVVANRVALGEKEHFRHLILRRRLTVEASSRVGDDAVLISRGLDGLDDYYRKYWPAFVSALILPLILGIWILIHDWVSALILVLTIPLIPLFMILIGQHTEERVDEAAEGLARISQNLYELARGLPALVGLHRSGVHGKALHKVSTEYRKTTMKTLRTAFMSSLALELIATLSVAVIAVFIGVRLVYGRMDLFDGLVVLVLAAEVYLPFREIGSAFHSSEDGLESLRRVRSELETSPPERLDWESTSTPDISVAGLTLAYAGANRPVLNDSNVAVAPGQLTVLGSASGTGKSTLLKTLAGVISAPNLSVSQRGKATSPRQRLYLSQHPTFTEKTVKEELHLYATGTKAVDQQIEEVLQIASAEHLYERVIAELSPGEQRRVAVSRVMLRALAYAEDRHHVAVFLDEPTAHLDVTSARLIRNGLVDFLAEHPNVTMVVASHDRILHGMAHRVLDIDDDGQLVDIAGPLQVPNTSVDSALEQDGAPARKRESSSDGATPVSFWKLLKYLPLREPRFLGGIALAVLTVLAAAALAALSGWLIVQASYQPPVLFLLAIIVGVRFFGIGRAASRYAERLATHRAVLDWATELRTKLWDALATNIRFWPVLTRQGGSLNLLISDVDELRDALPRVIVPIPAAILSWLATVGILWLILPDLVPIIVLAGLIGLLIVPTLIWWLERVTQRRLAEHRSWVMGESSLLLAGAGELYANDLSDQLLARFQDREANYQKHLKRHAFFAGIGQATAVLTSAVAAIVASVTALNAGLEAPMVALVAFLLLSLSEPFGQMSEATHEASVLAVQLQKLGPLLHESSDEAAGENRVLVTAPSDKDGLVSGLKMTDVAAQYPDTTAPVFTGLDFSVEKGELTMVTGESGSGKSTLLALVLGFLSPVAGKYELFVTDDTEAVTLPEAFSKIAWCPQESYLFNSTLQGNLALARDKQDAPDREMMIQVLDKVGLTPWFQNLSDGLDTKIGAGGSFLSGGQRQRLALARALLADADILLLDEPTAHLGEDEAEELIQDLQRLKREAGLVIVTHQLDYLRYADRHVSLNEDCALKL